MSEAEAIPDMGESGEDGKPNAPPADTGSPAGVFLAPGGYSYVTARQSRVTAPCQSTQMQRRQQKAATYIHVQRREAVELD